jgi:hypothetical protein
MIGRARGFRACCGLARYSAQTAPANPRPDRAFASDFFALN